MITEKVAPKESHKITKISHSFHSIFLCVQRKPQLAAK